MTTAQVVETSVPVNNNIPFQDYVHPDDQTQPTFGRHSLLKWNISSEFILTKEHYLPRQNLFQLLPLFLVVHVLRKSLE